MSTAMLEKEATKVRTLPWVRLGVDVKKCKTTECAINEAGLDWDVELQDVYRDSGGTGRPGKKLPGVFAVSRVDENEVLGIVRSKYKVFQNRDAFSFTETLLKNGDVQLVSAGQDRGGSVVFIVYRMAETVVVNGDEFEIYLVMRTTHDGSGAITVDVMPVRIICGNGMATVAEGRKSRWSVTHTSDVMAKLHEAESTLALTTDYVESFGRRMELMRGCKITPAKITKAIESAWPRGGEKARRDTIAGVMRQLQSSPTIADEDRGSVWGALNATTEYMQHVRGFRTDHQAFTSTLDGFETKVRTAIADLA